MDRLTVKDLLELVLASEQFIDSQIEFWLTVTFATIVASFAGDAYLTKSTRIIVSVLYILATILFMSRWIYEAQDLFIYMDELDTIVNRKASIEAFKALTSLDKVSVRRPYDRFTTESPRLASFIGSLNNREFLKDSTGNRRFFVLGVEEINYDQSLFFYNEVV